MSEAPPSSPPRRLASYEIVAHIGSGGMGDVYKATDTRLGRTVAIKFLKGPRTDRFLREARAIAALNHPHICTLYDIGEDYLVMEYVDGVPLAGPVASDHAVRLAGQVAAALEMAHARGVVHRDLKPANILLTPSGVKLLDFGLAVIDTAAAETVVQTQAGTIVGTAGYMSPEQAEGRRSDVRSDIFSFGAVLYELLSGRRAFGGETLAATLTAVLQQEPAPIEAPAALRAIVSRCLQKSPAERFQTMADVRRALEPLRVESEKPGASIASIAVLPFSNLSGDQDNQYFSDGLAEDILNALAHVPHLKVTARTSSFAFRGKDQDIRRIAETLDVRTILGGSVRRAGNRIRVSAQLISASDGCHLWSERYDRELTDIFAVQDEIAEAIVEALELQLKTRASAGFRYQPALPAYEAFLRGRYDLYRQTADSLPRAMESFGRAIALDARYPDPHVELGACHTTLWYHGLCPGRDAAPLIAGAVQQAHKLGDSAPWGQALTGIVAAAYDHRWEEAGRLLRLALAEGVETYGQVRWAYANFHLGPLGRFPEAIELIEQAIAQDPMNFAWRGALGQCLNLSGAPDRAVVELRRAAEMAPNYWLAHLHTAEAYIAMDQFEDARTAAERAYDLAPWSAHATGLLAGILMRTGDPRRAEVAARLLSAPEPHWAPAGMIRYRLLCGDVDQAADWLEKAVEQRDAWVVSEIRGTAMKPIRASARWPTLAAKMKLPNS